MNAGLVVEVWCKGFLWDRFLGYYYIPLSEVSYMNEVTRNQCNLSHTAEIQDRQSEQSDMCDTNSNTQPDIITDTETTGQWVSLGLELEQRGNEIVGTKKPTGHSLLIDCRLELPYDESDRAFAQPSTMTISDEFQPLHLFHKHAENADAADLQRKLEMLNNMMDQEARAEQARRQILYNIGHSGYSEDSDYTSDLNYPVGGQGANSSASQFRTAANQLATPQRSLETSRENSYERDDHQIPVTVGGRLAPSNYGSYGGPGHSPRYDEPYPEDGLPQRYLQTQQHPSESSEPLFYNSRPKHYKEYRRRKHTWDYEDSQDGWYSEGTYDYHSTRIDDTRIYSDTEYYSNNTSTTTRRSRGKAIPYRRPSLERQMTLYDDHSYYADGYSSDGRVGKMSATYPECETDIRYNEYYDTITGYVYQDERYGQDDEDRQWDSGGKRFLGTNTYGYNTRRRKILQPQQRPMSRQEGGTGKKLPPTPTKPSNVVISRKLASLPATPSRQLPKTRTPSEESYYKSDYNEDYNYAYRSQDNLPQDTYTENIYSQQQSSQTDSVNKTRYPEINQDNQYDYTTQVDGQYGQSYPEQHTQNSYEQPTAYAQQNSYKDEYQQPYAQQNTQAYQGTYLDTTYPIASQANDHQYANQAKDQYDKPDGMVIEDNFHEMGFNQNNVQYQQSDYKQQDVYQEQYDEYATVPTSVYDQNNVTNTYNQYQPQQYDSQYNINTSTDYQKTYQETYNQVPVTSQDNYQESYTKQPQENFVDYQTPYSKQNDVPATYKNNYQETYQDYQEPYDEYPDSYQGSFEEQRYKNDSSTATDRRQSEVPELSVTTPRGQTRTNGYPSSESEYLYQSQENEFENSSRRKKIGSKRETSPLLQQNTDSLESRDDELKDSFETAVSSVGSNQLKKAYSEYSTAGDSSPAPATLGESPQSIAQSQATTMVNHVTANHVTTTAMVHTTTNIVNGKRPLARTDSYQEDVIEDEDYPEIIPKETQRKDSHQSQLSQSTLSQKPKLTRGDSYVSDNYTEDSYSHTGSYAQLQRKDSFSSITEGFKPPLTRTDSYQQRDLRGNYGHNFTAPQPISRAESYQRGHFKDQESLDQSDIVLSNTVNDDYQMRDESLERYERDEEALRRNSREDSLVDPYKGTPPLSHIESPRGSIIKQASLDESVQMDTPPRSPPEPPADEELLGMVAPVPTQLKERPEMTARQRWHWAYNQIIMQLNVCKIKIPKGDLWKNAVMPAVTRISRSPSLQRPCQSLPSRNIDSLHTQTSRYPVLRFIAHLYVNCSRTEGHWQYVDPLHRIYLTRLRNRNSILSIVGYMICIS
ncbi:Phorbol ester/diacylglycerol-binding protein unc-13 [Trachymyrmex septentrionalis]|uniref:Phorbol ester/diacylglycerol-binding protein unc-13 n=1 Tax=Trachymyrmex septentrionalis TaxID=34720 RepID=A0A195FLE4_9HYME|nr:Phorbol ester/diacylglycerol-binding protein unc-13 [Trachymyrmex septentrionalis]